MTLALDALTIDELEKLITEAKALISQKSEAEIQKVYLQMLQLAAGLGLSIDDVILRARRASSSMKSDKPKTTVAPRYQNPNNSLETWTGRGKTPRWIIGLQAQGVNLESLLINR